MGRRSILALVAAVAVLAAGLGWVAGRQIKSPGQIAAEQEPPDPSLITVPVEFRTLSQNVIVRGTVRLSDQTPLSVGSTVGSSVITRLSKEAGDTIEEGDVIVEVAGRPVLALEGSLPAFRNLIPGLEGPDVEQLQESLIRLGYDPGTANGVYGPSTASAVEALYRDRGYLAPETDSSLQGAVDSAQSDVQTSQISLNDAKTALADAGSTVTDLERKQLDLAIDQAKAALVVAKSDAERAKAEATQAVTDAQQAVTDAEASGDEQAIAGAKAALAEAKAAQSLITTEQDLTVRAADIGVGEAEAAKTDRLRAPDLSQLQAAVTEATKSLDQARTSLADARTDVGAWIPTAEVEFLSSTPRQVSSLTAEVGDIPTGSIMTISGAETIIESGVSTADRSLVEVGAEAVLEDDDLGLAFDAVVSFVADTAGGPGLSDDRFAVRLEPVDEIPEEAIGLNLRISIPITSSGGDVLAVPLAALSAGADGTARVEIERNVGETELVEVSTGLRADGFVAIEPLAGARLVQGDRVVVGRDLDLSTGDDGSDQDENDDSGEDDEGDG